jgi:hypothetical protein
MGNKKLKKVDAQGQITDVFKTSDTIQVVWKLDWAGKEIKTYKESKEIDIQSKCFTDGTKWCRGNAFQAALGIHKHVDEISGREITAIYFRSMVSGKFDVNIYFVNDNVSYNTGKNILSVQGKELKGRQMLEQEISADKIENHIYNGTFALFCEVHLKDQIKKHTNEGQIEYINKSNDAEFCNAKVVWKLNWEEAKIKSSEKNKTIDIESKGFGIGAINSALGIRRYIDETNGYEKASIYLRSAASGMFDVNLYLTNDNQSHYNICSVKGQELNCNQFFSRKVTVHEIENFISNGSFALSCEINSNYKNSSISINETNDKTIINDFEKNAEIKNQVPSDADAEPINCTRAFSGIHSVEQPAYFASSGEESFQIYPWYDYKIICQDQVQCIFNCHKKVLCSDSELFKRMLQEKSVRATTSDKDVHIATQSSKIIKKLLQFMYTGIENIELLDLELLEAAIEYEISSLVTICVEHLKSNINLDNCIDLLLASNERRVELYRKHIVYFIQANWEKVKLSKNIENITKCPEALLEIVWDFPSYTGNIEKD